MAWKDIKLAPKDGKPFLAWYESKFGPSFGTMKWEPEPKGNGGRFHSMTMGTQTKCATHWMDPEPPVPDAKVAADVRVAREVLEKLNTRIGGRI